MKKRVLIKVGLSLLCYEILCAKSLLRDPFYYDKRYTYKAYAQVNHASVAIIEVESKVYWVKEGDTILDYKVELIDNKKVELVNFKGYKKSLQLK